MDLLKLEQQRQALETNLEKLRESLKHWQTWEAEYEGLKEEVLNIGDDNPTVLQLENIATTYNGELVDEKEVRELSGLDKDSPRPAQQIIGLVERRQEYVQKNIETVQRQFFDAEAKAEELAFAAANQHARGDAGLPLTEIHEELDENGNVISSHLSQPEESTANIVESLRKAGLKESDLPPTTQTKLKPEDLKPAITNASPPITPSALGFEKRGQSDSALSRSSSGGAEDLERPSIRKKSVSFTADTKPPEEKPRPESQDGRKSVSFAEKVAVMPAAPPADTRSVSFSPMVEEIPAEPPGTVSPDMAPRIAADPQSMSTVPTDAVKAAVATNMTDQANSAAVIIPEDESPEDARVRREMLEYHLNEVGSVVAQIDLEEPDVDMDDDEDDNNSYYTTSEYLEDEDTPYTTGLSESEEDDDEFGRTKRRMVTPEYRKQMDELQQRLIGNLGPAPKDEDVAEVDPDLDPKDAQRLVIRNKRESMSSASSDNSEKKSNSKKRVSFAESLDVAEPGSPPLKAQKHQEGENVAPFTSAVVERTTAASHSLPQNLSNESISRFKKDRAAPITFSEDDSTATAGSAIDDTDVDVDMAPTGPPGVTIADKLTERVLTRKPVAAPSINDADPMLERRELVTEFYKRRNDMIQQQGGFTAASEEDERLGELMEERDGKLKKVSKFKAARIKPTS